MDIADKEDSPDVLKYQQLLIQEYKEKHMDQHQNNDDDYNEDQEEEKGEDEEEKDEEQQENNYGKFQMVINRHHTEIAELIEESDHKEDMGFHKDD